MLYSGLIVSHEAVLGETWTADGTIAVKWV